MPWEMDEAEPTAVTDKPLIRWVQVGLGIGPFEPKPDWKQPTYPGWALLAVRRRSVDPAIALPALVQCVDDALPCFGAVELSSLQLAAIGLNPGTRSCAGDPSPRDILSKAVLG